MKKTCLLFTGLLALSLLLPGCCLTNSCPAPKAEINANEILQQAEAAVMPSPKAKESPLTVKMHSKYDQMNITLRTTGPDQIRLDFAGKDSYATLCFNGKEAWVFDSKAKPSLQIIPEQERGRLLFFLSMIAPGTDFVKIFPDIKLAGSEELAGQDCWKLTGQSIKELGSLNVELLIRKKDHMISRMALWGNPDDDADDLIIHYGVYKNYDGVKLPSFSNGIFNGHIISREITEVSLDTPISPKIFHLPIQLSK